MFKNKILLITGGTGSWGNELVTQIISTYEVEEIIIYSRGEHKQVEMSALFRNNAEILRFDAAIFLF